MNPTPTNPDEPLTCLNLVDLIRRYSNRADLQERLGQACLRLNQHDQELQQPTLDSVSGQSSGVWRVRDRLTEDQVMQLIAEFLSGTSKRELAERYDLSFSTVKNILRRHGARRN